MKCPIIKKCGGCFYPQDQYQDELKYIQKLFHLKANNKLYSLSLFRQFCLEVFRLLILRIRLQYSLYFVF